jgi:hypothetical protein
MAPSDGSIPTSIETERLGRPGRRRRKSGKPNDIACGSYPLHRDADLRLAPFIAIGALPGSDIDPGYDGIFWLGTVSASPPAYTKR